MFKTISKNQKNALIICALMLVSAVFAGIVTRFSYSTLSLDDDAYYNAKIDFAREDAKAYDGRIILYNLETAQRQYESSCNYIFKIKCLSVEHCYGCTKYYAEVLKTIKGDIDETGQTIAVYHAVWFDEGGDNSLAFANYDYSFPLKAGKTYLVFVNKRDYVEEYQQTLDGNEYDLEPFIAYPTAYALDEPQRDFIDLNTDKTLADVQEQNYICFSRKALDHMNRFAKEVIEYYDSQ